MTQTRIRVQRQTRKPDQRDAEDHRTPSGKPLPF
jgi:hypothetical protein